MFITVNILIWDNKRRSFKYAPAGHEHLIIYRAATRKVETIKAGGVACGVLKQASAMYQEKELAMSPGDHLLLYTDGVTEAMDEEQNQFSLETTVKLVEQHGHLDPKSLCEGIYQSILQFRGAADPHDDITLVALKAR
jgi:serine phosphatase RsbU (regulator of sigma subunit)